MINVKGEFKYPGIEVKAIGNKRKYSNGNLPVIMQLLLLINTQIRCIWQS